jgi:tight adherence protein B
VIISSAAAFAGFLLARMTLAHTGIPGISIGAAALFSLIPLAFVSWKRKRRLAKFEEQFPEALNFVSRAMRAGHAFTIGLEMLVADAPEPLRSCFRRVLSSMQLGSPLEVSLAELTQSVPLIDVRFFVSAVLLQQGTGGNLGEILDTMAQIIRERFRVKGSVKAASAHGRITGAVLCLMPPVVGAIMMVISPEYLLKLVHDPLGVKLLYGSAIAQVIGFLCVRKIVRIKV